MLSIVLKFKASSIVKNDTFSFILNNNYIDVNELLLVSIGQIGCEVVKFQGDVSQRFKIVCW